MVISLQPTIWKTGGKFIVHFFQSISHISDLIESEDLQYFLLLKLKEFNYSQTESEQHYSGSKNCPNVCTFWKDWHGEKW